jgi:SAM-dependent methyltransferase
MLKPLELVATFCAVQLPFPPSLFNWREAQTKIPMSNTQRVSAQTGYDLWSESYDETPNPVVALDARHTMTALNPQAGEHVLDAGCGTGRNLGPLLAAGAIPAGLDFSAGMLAVARRKYPQLDLRQGDLQQTFPWETATFDAALCALIGEHLSDPGAVCREIFRVLKPGGRFVFSVYHPWLAAAGKEANFEKDGVDYRLGAFTHTTENYLAALTGAGFTTLAPQEFLCDEALVAAVPRAQKYLGRPLLLVLNGYSNNRT